MKNDKEVIEKITYTKRLFKIVQDKQTNNEVKKSTLAEIFKTQKEIEALEKSEIETPQLTTPNDKSYWDGNGAYQKEYDQLNRALVPDMGEANTINGEMIRIIGRLTYDFCNNGNCNVISHEVVRQECSCEECSGRGVVDEYNEETEEDEEVDCGVCGGSGESYEAVDGDAIIEGFYEKMIDFLEKHLTNKEVVKNLRAFLLDNSKGYSKYTFEGEEMRVYNELADAVIYQCLTTENVEREIED